MSIQTAPRVRTVRRINRADSRVREDDTGVKAEQEDKGEEREDNVQRGQNRINTQSGTTGNKNMISDRENENKNKTPVGAFISKTETRKKEGNTHKNNKCTKSKNTTKIKDTCRKLMEQDQNKRSKDTEHNQDTRKKYTEHDN